MTARQARERFESAVLKGISPLGHSEPLALMLVACEKAHKASGEPDENWADWYARWLLGYIVTDAVPFD